MVFKRAKYAQLLCVTAAVQSWTLTHFAFPAMLRNDERARKARPESLSKQLKTVEKERDMYKAIAKKHRADAVKAMLALNQTFEQNEPKKNVPINPTVKQAAQLDKHINPDPMSPASNRFIQTEQVRKKKKVRVHCDQ